jgi:hypothetical protein
MQLAVPQPRIVVPISSSMPLDVVAEFLRAVHPAVQAAGGAVLLMTYEPADVIQAPFQKAVEASGITPAVQFLTISTSGSEDAIHPALLNSADTIAFAQAPDATGFTIFAAMACARLIIAPDAPPFNEILNSDNALLIQGRDFGPAVLEALRQPEQFIERRRRARFDVERLYTTYFVVGHVRERLRQLGGHLQSAETVAMTPALAQIVRNYDLPA